MLKCPNCNHKLYKGEDGVSYCKNCLYINKKMKDQKVKIEPLGITTSKDIPTGTTIELTEEQKAKKKENDLKVLDSYNFQIDNINVEIEHLNKILEKDLTTREIKDRLRALAEQLERFINLKKVIEQRNK